ncbi:C signal [Hartmannibacter diazotrophicus]|uniref:C signal n=1 Tax=Hartmannibacter diazotrophicus TaxID=1482074 RepID=A0A2C9DDD0_9HYPH|nr:SDR family NAD(P)-dependent oxidoreductase [Hartmannibacter diazotrophicus]SON58170.1 C signal [Hartmannibacter diazotrophicus]
MTTITSLGSRFTALVIGASGGIGSAVAEQLEADPNCARVIRLSRRTTPDFDLEDEGAIAGAAATIAETTPRLDLVFNATGALFIHDVGPEKTIRALDPQAMAQQFAINAIGPALLIKHFSPLLPKNHRSLFGSITARVGSIGDNRLGGWISYRAAKAAQNQIVRTAAIELARTRPLAVLAALHPGTVATSLSDPFAAGHDRLSPEKSAAMMLAVLDGLAPDRSGGFFAYDGSRIEW